MKLSAWILVGAFALTGCGAVSAELQKGMADAKAADTAGWVVNVPIDTAYRGAFDYIKAADPGKVTSTNGGGTFGAARRYVSSGDSGTRYDVTIDSMRMNDSGALPDQKRSRFWKVVIQKKDGSNWVDWSDAEIDAEAKKMVAATEAQ